MQKIIYIIILLIGYNAIAQNNVVIAKGAVLATDNNEPVKNALIRLKSGGISLFQQTDSDGKYEFRFEADSSTFCTISITMNKHTVSPTFKSGFLASKDVGKLEIQKDTVFVKNFAVVPVSCGLIKLPSILFYTNVIERCNDSANKVNPTTYEGFDDALLFMFAILKDDPGMVIELQGHASSIEKNPQQLSLKRAQYIRQLLVEKGINAKRIKVKGLGISKLLVPDAIIKKAKTTEEKRMLHLNNQRLVFRIVSWDFVKKGEEEVPDLDDK